MIILFKHCISWDEWRKLTKMNMLINDFFSTLVSISFDIWEWYIFIPVYFFFKCHINWVKWRKRIFQRGGGKLPFFGGCKRVRMPRNFSVLLRWYFWHIFKSWILSVIFKINNVHFTSLILGTGTLLIESEVSDIIHFHLRKLLTKKKKHIIKAIKSYLWDQISILWELPTPYRSYLKLETSGISI